MKKKYKKHKIAVFWMVLSGHLLSLTLAFFLKSTYLIHENITCSVVKRISWHIYGALDIDFPALCLLLMSFFSVWAAGLQVVPESPPYRQRAGSSIRRRREHLFSAVLMLQPLNHGVLKKKKAEICIRSLSSENTQEIRLLPLSAAHNPLTCVYLWN